MFGLSKLLSALNTLAENVLALAGTMAEINTGLRGRLAFDGAPTAAAALTHELPQDGAAGTGAADGLPMAGRGSWKCTRPA
jgi:hypothetical protein